MTRYALWDDNRQRFLMGPSYQTEQEAEIVLEQYRKLQPNRKLYIVECWDKDDD